MARTGFPHPILTCGLEAKALLWRGEERMNTGSTPIGSRPASLLLVLAVASAPAAAIKAASGLVAQKLHAVIRWA